VAQWAMAQWAVPFRRSVGCRSSPPRVAKYKSVVKAEQTAFRSSNSSAEVEAGKSADMECLLKSR